VLKNVAVDEGNVGVAGELCPQNRYQPLVKFDGDDAAGSFGKMISQRAEAGAYLQDGVGRLKISGTGDAGQVSGVDEKVLA